MSIQIIGWLIWGIVLILAVLWTIGWRIAVVSQRPMQKSTGVFIFFLWVIDVLFFIFDWNKLHILWALPVSLVFSMRVVFPRIPVKKLLEFDYPRSRAGHYAKFMAKATAISKVVKYYPIHLRSMNGVFWVNFYKQKEKL